MDGFWEWSFEVKFGVIVAAGFAIWAMYGYVRYGLDDPPEGGQGDSSSHGAGMGRAGLDSIVGVGGALALNLIIWAGAIGVLMVWSALST